MNLILIFLLTIIIFEILFRVTYFFKNKKKYKNKKKVLFSKIHYESHPYLPFKLKKNFKNSGEIEVNYPLKKKYKFVSPSLISNNLGFYNGNNGDRNIDDDKKNKIRVNCLGGSTTMNYLKDNENNISYPIQLQKKLDKFNKDKFEVNNLGQGLYNSTDILVSFITNTIYTKPDIIILYIGYNDIRSYLTNNFNTDHSHSRKNLNFRQFQKFLNYIAYDFNLNFLNYIFSKFGIYNIKESLTYEISKGEFNLGNDPKKGLEVFHQNIEILISICKSKNIRLIMSSFCHNLYDELKNDELHIKFHQIVNKENEILRDLAKKNDVEFVDNNLMLKKNNDLFVDTIHFSKEGMDMIAENFYKQIISQKN